MLYALYNGKSELVEPLLDANPPLDVFDAAAVGRTRGLEELLDGEPELVTLVVDRTASRRCTSRRSSAQEEAAEILVARGAEVERRRPQPDHPS